MKLTSFFIYALLACLPLQLMAKIEPGQLWPDTDGEHINAHGGGILAMGDKYYWYGEHKCDTTCSAMVGVMCYSSTDLEHWTNLGPALRVVDQKGHDIERGCVLERPKVVYNSNTGKYVMWFHLELKGRGYEAARYGVAIADDPAGPFTFLRSDRVCPGISPMNVDWEYGDLSDSLQAFNDSVWWTPEWLQAVKQGLYTNRDLEHGQMARDMTIYVDTDGKAYHIYSSEENMTLQIAELTDDYTAHTGRYVRVAPGEQNEAPAIFKHGDTYWMITSGCTGWAPNEARMYSAPTIWGPWTRHANPCRGPKAELTFGGQSTYVLQLPNGREIFMADIWRPEFPSDGRYVWLPITWADGRPQVQWSEAWDMADIIE